MLDVWMTPIRLDPKWNNGDYYGRDEPQEGVANRTQDRHHHDARAWMGRQDLWLQAGRRGKGSCGRDG